MTTYPFKQGIDYGPRAGTLGLSFHMAEGGDGTLGYLQRHVGETFEQWVLRINGVSCHALALTDGTVVQMLDWTHASGNLNPHDRAGEYGYYGHHYLEDVLGDHWPDPNAWNVSMEIVGYRSAATAPSTWKLPPGPTDAQVRAAIAWGADMKERFPSIRGANGHHDQAPKGCPGTTFNMKAIFAGVGGHGLWPAHEEPQIMGLPLNHYKPAPGFATVKNDGLRHAAIQLADRELVYIAGGVGKPIIGEAIIGIDPSFAGLPVWVIGASDDTELAAFLKRDVDFKAAPVPPPDCSVQIGKAVNAALDHVAPAVAGTAKAIEEARIRG